MEVLHTLVAGVPVDVGVVVILLGLTLLYNYTIGKYRIIMLLVALYLAGAVIMLAPVLKMLQTLVPIPSLWLSLGLLAVMTALTTFVLARSTFFDDVYNPHGWRIAVYSLLQVIVVVVILVTMLPLAVTGDLSPNFARVFMDPIIRSILILAPLVTMALLRG
ncbi:TPA: hypothetical protein DEP96_03400 [Candidatus Uhrbacteria bacterium]|nr:hypothetical protein [Candidatus Uhrbacteria bacterium]